MHFSLSFSVLLVDRDPVSLTAVKARGVKVVHAHGSNLRGHRSTWLLFGRCGRTSCAEQPMPSLCLSWDDELLVP